MEGRELLRRLLSAGGLSGVEAPAAAVVREAWGALADDLGEDALGNLWAFRQGSGQDRPTVAFAAHLDVIGLVVTRLLPGGFLGFASVGGVDLRSLLGREVAVSGRREVPAVVATVPPHLTLASDRRRIPALNRLVLDTGLDDEVLAQVVRPGDRARLDTPPTALMGERLSGAGLDNRAGVVALHEALCGLRGVDLPCDLVCVANVQEEVGLRGVAAAGRRLRPTAAVVVDVGFGSQPGAPDHETFPLGKGPVLGVGPALHPAVTALLQRSAAGIECTLPREAAPGATGTDAWALQVAAGGVPTGLLSLPLRSMHTPVEVVDYTDIARTGRVLGAFARAADGAWAQGLTTRLC